MIIPHEDSYEFSQIKHVIDPFANDPRPLHDRWIIDRLMPEREVHLLAGPAGVGKTTLSMQILSDIQDGLPVFGRRTFPTPVVLVSCDRSFASHERMIADMGVPAQKFKFFSQRNSPTTIFEIVTQCARNFPACRLIFIDGFATLVPNAKLSDYGEVSSFLRLCGRLCEQFNVTILGSLHATKTKEGESYTNPRQRVLGSVAWSGFADLIITIDAEKPSETENQIRLVNVLPRNSAEFALKYQRENEKLVLYTDPGELDLLSMLDAWLRSQSFDREFPTREVLQEAERNQVPRRSAERWLERVCDGGLVARVRKGVYKPLRVS